MNKLSSDRLSELKPSGLRKLFDLEHKLSQQTEEKILSFGLGNLNIPIPQTIIDKLKDTLDDPVTHRYSPNAGLPTLREAIKDKYYNKYGVDQSFNDVVVTSGALEGLLDTFLAYINPGDEVIVQDPTFRYFDNQIMISGGKVVNAKLDQDFELDPITFQEQITDKTKAIVLNFPCNPTGSVMTRNQIKAIIEIAEEKNIIVISDESYEQILYDGHEHTCSAEFGYENTIVISSFSKSYCMTGLRLGYVFGKKDLISPILLVHQQNTACASTPSQMAAIIALKSGPTIREPIMKELGTRRKAVIEAFTNIPGIKLHYNPLGAFYIYPDVSGTGMDGEKFSEFALNEAKVVVVPGTEFGSTKNNIRVSYGFLSVENIIIAGERLKTALENK